MTKYTGSSSESGGSSAAWPLPVRRCISSRRATTIAISLESRSASDSVAGPPARAGMVAAYRRRAPSATPCACAGIASSLISIFTRSMISSGSASSAGATTMTSKR